jgi:hypothetical protein
VNGQFGAAGGLRADSSSGKMREFDNRGSHFYMALYWFVLSSDGGWVEIAFGGALHNVAESVWE